MVPSLLDTCSLGSIKSSWLVLSLLFGCAGAVNPNPCPLPPVSEGANLTTITHDGVSRSWYTYVTERPSARQAQSRQSQRGRTSVKSEKRPSCGRDTERRECVCVRDTAEGAVWAVASIRHFETLLVDLT